MELRDFFRKYPKVALGLSGGVDSVYLLHEAVKEGADVRAYYVKTAFQPAFEAEDAVRAAKELGADLKVIELDILEDDAVTANPENRCYFCKKRIFSAIMKAASDDGYRVVLDGTNASDDTDDRPGMKAIGELKVLSPLREAGLTKDEIRKRSREAGLFTWDKPSYACLATRIPTGRRITAEKLERTERGEDALRGMGFKDFRIRYLSGVGRLQLTKADMERAFRMRNEIKDALEGLYDGIVVDLEERNGSD